MTKRIIRRGERRSIDGDWRVDGPNVRYWESLWTRKGAGISRHWLVDMRRVATVEAFI